LAAFTVWGGGGDKVGVMKILLLASAAVLLAAPASADDWSLSPWTGEIDNLSFSVGGLAHAALFVPDLPKAAGYNQRWATGAADVTAKIERDYDSGLALSLNTAFEVVRDRLSYDNYGGNLVQKVYGRADTGLGRIEAGLTDGAAYVLSVTGPAVDDITTIDNPNASFFMDPSTGRSFQEVFGLSTAVNSSSNYAKISYYTPRILGLQIGASFTPSEGREVIPFLNNGPQAANRQKSIWETAVSYSQSFEGFAVGFYVGVSLAHGDGKAAGDGSLTDWGLGGEIDYDLTEDVKLAVGGGYRRSNTFTFDIYDARTTGNTESSHLSTTLSWGDWIAGAEYGSGTADGGALGPVVGVRAYEASIGYIFNTNLQATIGWQQLNYTRNTGVFYDGAARIEPNAAFLHLKFKV
jgi:hypothetical protein